MEEPETIKWGFNDEPQNIRSEEHRNYLITKYNKDRPEEQHVRTMEELTKALKKEKQN